MDKTAWKQIAINKGILPEGQTIGKLTPELVAMLGGFESIHRAIRIESGKNLSLSMTLIVTSLEQAVVTAEKTGATDIQSTPLAISVIPSAALSRFAIRTVDEASPQTPSVTFTQNTTFGQLSIRGIGTRSFARRCSR